MGQGQYMPFPLHELDLVVRYTWADLLEVTAPPFDPARPPVDAPFLGHGSWSTLQRVMRCSGGMQRELISAARPAGV